MRQDLGELADRIKYVTDPYEAAKGAHVIALLTEWPEFAELNYHAICKSMVHPLFIFDGRNILDHQDLYECGFNVFAVGKAPMKHFNENHH